MSRPNINYHIEEEEEEDVEEVILPPSQTTKRASLFDKIQQNLYRQQHAGIPIQSARVPTQNQPQTQPVAPTRLVAPAPPLKNNVVTFDDILRKMRVKYVGNQLQYEAPLPPAPPIYDDRQIPWTEEQIKLHILTEKIKKRIANLKIAQNKSRKLILPGQNIQIARGSDDMNKLFSLVGR